MFNPKVSIIIPVYNGSNFLSESISSALNQTYPNIEIIVVNDGSNDNGATEQIALSYGEKIRYFKKENGGSSSALNYGIRQMTGDYFSWLSHDDLYERDRVEKMLKKITSYADNQIVICSERLIDASGDIIYYPKKKLNGIFKRKELFELLKKGYKINGCGIMIPKYLVDEIGFFDENFKYVNDRDYWYRLIIRGGIFICFDEPLVKTRIHQNQVTVTHSNLYETENARLSKKVFDNLFENMEYNIELIQIHLNKAAIDGNMAVVKSALTKLKTEKYFKKQFYVKILFCFLYGRILKTAKKIYKKIFFKR